MVSGFVPFLKIVNGDTACVKRWEEFGISTEGMTCRNKKNGMFLSAYLEVF